MTEVLPFDPKHYEEIDQDETAGIMQSKEHAILIANACGENAYSIRIDGKIFLCGGVATLWPGRGEAWAIIDKKSKPHFSAIHKASRKFFDECPVKRIEASIPVDFEKARRWIELLGFELEANSRRAYMPDGSDWALYARVK